MQATQTLLGENEDGGPSLKSLLSCYPSDVWTEGGVGVGCGSAEEKRILVRFLEPNEMS